MTARAPRVTLREIQQLQRLQSTVEELRALVNRNWSSEWYKQRLYGGWTRPQDGKVMGGHKRSRMFHLADRARFCSRDLGGGVRCHRFLGFVDKDPFVKWKCPGCGAVSTPYGTSLGAIGYRSMFLCGSNRSWKSLNGINALSAWIRGHRPWDGTLTAPRGTGRNWFVAGQTFASAFKQTLEPYIEKCLGDMIADKKTNNGNLAYYEFENRDRLYGIAYTQYERVGKGEGAANPLEGTAWYGGLWDEPMHPGAYNAVSRGLTSGRSQGWGRELICATPLYSPFLWQLYNQSAMRGGHRQEVWVDEFDIHENTMMTAPEIQEFLATIPLEEREAREHGRFLNLFGRIYDIFDLATHVIDDEVWNPLYDDVSKSPGNRLPGRWPISHVVDPHDARPWAMGWYAIGPNDERVVVKEWPDEPWENIRGKNRLGYRDYGDIIKEVEASIPGGPSRVCWRTMDPNKGRTGNTAGQGLSIAQAMRLPENGGYYFRTEVNDDIVDGHHAAYTKMAWDTERPVDGLNKPHFLCLLSCRNHHWSLSHYTRPPEKNWDTFERIKPEGPAVDFADLVRYECISPRSFVDWRRGSRRVKDYNDRLAGEWQRSMGSYGY